MGKVNLFEELLSERNKEISSDELKSIVKKIWSNHDSKKDQIRMSLNKKNNDKYNRLKFDKMESKNIFHKETIKKICIRYRLRFLDSNLFSEEIYFFSQLPVIINYTQILKIALISIILSFLSTIYPSIRASKVDPINLIKWD